MAKTRGTVAYPVAPVCCDSPLSLQATLTFAGVAQAISFFRTASCVQGLQQLSQDESEMCKSKNLRYQAACALAVRHPVLKQRVMLQLRPL
eukprot:904359-Rhodomonas_salina.1